MVPKSIPLHLLQEITNNFSEVHVLGRGGYGTVYKGVRKDGETVAVKLLYSTMPELDEDTFQRELCNLASVRHPNIVRLLGYSHETRQEMVNYNGKLIVADRIQMALCLEYMCNGSLAKYLSDEPNGQDWHTNYRIIKGICKGLKCLHEESNTPILHLDLKPDNILLDEKMEPKITDFGLSRLLREDRTQITKRIMGTLGYVSPETINEGVISKTCDIFSLGVIIMKILVGSKANYGGMSSHEFIDHVRGMWINRLKASPKYVSDLEAYSEQVRTCIEIALECKEMDRHKRPSIGDIIDKLEKTETMISFLPTSGQGSSTDQMMPFMSGSIEQPDAHLRRLFQEFHNNFSKVHGLVRGGYGTVYKGMHEDGETISVKLIHSTMPGLDKDTFQRELCNLASVRHANIVRLVGFCYGTRKEMVKYDGKLILPGRIQMELYLEYMCSGSLEKFLSDKPNGQVCCINYRTIKGICEGSKWLHGESNLPILHFDLKPDNILLDEKMEPKIADFGLSRFLREDRTQITKRTIRSLVLQSPINMGPGVISKPYDIFSLGVIIMKILVGSKANYGGMSSHEFIDHVLGIWINRLKTSPKYASDLEAYSKQVRTLIEIASECVETDRHKRPSIGDTIDKLEKTETMISFPSTSGQGSSTDQMMPFMSGSIELLDAHPLRLSFPFEQNKLISCPLRVKNKTDHYVAFRCLPKTRERCFSKLWQLWDTLPPRSTRTYVVTVGKQQQQPPDVDELAVIQSCVVPSNAENTSNMNFAGAISGTGAKPHQVTLMAVFSQAEDSTTSEPIRPVMKMIQWEDSYGEVWSIDIHPKAPWILAGHAHGYVSIWNYETQKKVMAVNLREEAGLLHSLEHSSCSSSIVSTRFAPKADWFAVGDACGYIHVHRYMPNGAVKVLKILKAHSRGVLSLAIHPSESMLLSSCDGSIKVWNWEDGWECTGRFKARSRSIVFDPRNNGTFASVSTDGTVEIWNIYSPDRPVTTLPCHDNMAFTADYFTPDGDNWYIITGTMKGLSLIWDLRTNTNIAILEGSNPARQDKYHFTQVGVTDNLDGPPLLITIYQNVVSLFSSTNYSCQNTIEFDLGQVYGCVYIKRTTSKDSKNRLAIAMDGGIAIMEIIHEYPSYTKENRV